MNTERKNYNINHYGIIKVIKYQSLKNYPMEKYNFERQKDTMRSG